MAEGPELIERFLDSVNRLDFDAMRGLLHDEFVDEMPQSGERVRGRENYVAIIANYPSGERIAGSMVESAKVFGGERWLMTPSFSLVSVQGSGDSYTAIVKSRYPDDSIWHICQIFTIRDGKIWRSITLFAKDFEPPEWRSPWIERM